MTQQQIVNIENNLHKISEVSSTLEIIADAVFYSQESNSVAPESLHASLMMLSEILENTYSNLHNLTFKTE